MELSLAGIEVVAQHSALFLFLALVVGVCFGWYCAAPRQDN